MLIPLMKKTCIYKLMLQINYFSSEKEENTIMFDAFMKFMVQIIYIININDSRGKIIIIKMYHYKRLFSKTFPQQIFFCWPML